MGTSPTGRAKSGAECALSGQWTGKSKLECDHVEGHVSLLCWEDVLPFILHLVPPKGSLQLVDKEMHKVKSYSERMGISFTEALLIKKAIEIQNTKQDKQWLSERGITPSSNAAKRRAQIIEKLKEEDDDL